MIRSTPEIADLQAPPGRVSSGSAGRRRLLLLLILALGILARSAIHQQLADGPCLALHRWQETDMAFFLSWAQQIADGDLLTHQGLHPHHSWHQIVARQWFRQHPDQRDQLARAHPGTPPEESLWNVWFGGRRYHQAPLYAHILACLPGGTERRAGFMLLIQQALGCAGILLAYALGARLFGTTAGLCAAAFAALGAPLIGHELVLLRASLVALCSLLLPLLAVRARKSETLRAQTILGLACGCAILLKSIFMPLTLALAAMLAVTRGRPWIWRTRTAGIILLAAALPLAPLVARNITVGEQPLALPRVGAPAFVMLNAEGAPQGTQFRLNRHAAEVLGQNGGRLLPSALAAIRTHDSLAGWLKLLGRRFLAIWRGYEAPNNVNLQYFALHAPLLAWLPGFALLGALGIAGVCLASGRPNACAPLLLFVLGHVLILVFFGSFSRYRLPLLAALLPFAGLTCSWLLTRLRDGRQALAALVALLVAGAAIAMHARGVESGYEVRYADHAAAQLVYYAPRVAAARRAGKLEEVVRLLHGELAHEPTGLQRLGPGRHAADQQERLLASFFIDVRQNLARSLRQQGHPEQAAPLEARTRELLAAIR